MQSHRTGIRLLYWLTLLSGMFECLCFAGVVFGYASLVFVLKEDGYFSQLCVVDPDRNGTTTVKDCTSQDEKFALVFTIASFLNNFMNLFSGILFDYFGTMVTRLLAICLYTTGTLLVTISNAMSSILLFPALSCIAVGGMLLLMTNLQVGNLFATHRSTIITLYSGAFDSSSAVFLIIKVLHEQGISLRSSFLVMSFCSIIHIVRTFTLLPRKRFPYPLPQYYTYGLKCGKSNSYNVEQNMTEEGLTFTGKPRCRMNKPKDETDLNPSGEVASFRSCVLSWFFLWQLLWLSIMQLRHYLFIGTLNPMLIRLAQNDANLVSRYTNAFALTQLCGVLCSPWNGLILDRHKGKPRSPGETEREADLRSSLLSLFLTALQCLLFSLCASIPSLPLQYFTFVLQVINRSFIYGGNAAFINIAFPACHFGKLYGLVMSMSAVISLLQYPCFALIRGPLGGDPFYVDIALTLITLVVFIHPLFVFIHCKKIAQHRRK
ncbi:equilibrative nucleobase transporter 1-like isoform X1 [Corythoichthys intestinalis]|uniref:equilibrative nucleobase transporter 1-like isoform X1 n=1 Tax=Corythoichthys intestinalis TaxID=161448 RepID=UPI0025A5B3BF|nr:equilibrative nucleobase transporter 1-like isoform X1 [Corythoichthys intestinalis]XP_057700172.1 equilibrative nucleobase transporter 1-like isoform X1 [Corythoichthys intestinalis]XP_061792176.1 equilibrative nucleobase transporter 1-like [Nerophis lumbriciformis]